MEATIPIESIPVPTEIPQLPEIPVEQWEVIQDFFSATFTIQAMTFAIACVICGVVAGVLLWRWMK